MHVKARGLSESDSHMFRQSASVQKFWKSFTAKKQHSLTVCILRSLVMFLLQVLASLNTCESRRILSRIVTCFVKHHVQKSFSAAKPAQPHCWHWEQQILCFFSRFHPCSPDSKLKRRNLKNEQADCKNATLELLVHKTHTYS